MIESKLVAAFDAYVAGRWLTAQSDNVLPVRNPGDGEHLVDVPDLSIPREGGIEELLEFCGPQTVVSS